MSVQLDYHCRKISELNRIHRKISSDAPSGSDHSYGVLVQLKVFSDLRLFLGQNAYLA